VTASAANPAGASVICVPKEVTLPKSSPIKAATGGSSCLVGLTGGGADFILSAKGNKATFGPTSTTATCSVQICGDTVREPDEGFSVELSSPQGATIANGTAGIVIKNDD